MNRFNPSCIARCDEFSHASAFTDVDLRRLTNALSRHGLKQRARHAEDIEAEIANRERIKAGALCPDVLSGANLYGAGLRKVVLESGKESLQGLESAGEQHVGVLGLWRAGPRRRLRRKHITLQHRHFPEMPGKSLSGGKPGHAGANHHSMISCETLHEYLQKKYL